MISIAPLVILVGIAKAWKKLVFSGPIPVLGGHNDVDGSKSSSLSWSLHLVCQQQITHMQELLVGEHKANILLDVRQQTLEVRVGLKMSTDGLPHHGVLTHHNDSLSSQGNPDFLHLL